MLGYPHDVRDVVLGADGVLDSADAGTVLIDMTTSDPTLAEEIASAATGKGVSSLDAPVSGGDLGARNAALTIMVGGDAAAFESARPLFDLMGATVVLQGGPGNGPRTKLVNPKLIASTQQQKKRR